MFLLDFAFNILFLGLLQCRFMLELLLIDYSQTAKKYWESIEPSINDRRIRVIFLGRVDN
jgi:hypothetical protein